MVLLDADKCTSAAVAAAAGTEDAGPHEPAAAAVTTMGSGGALGPLKVEAFVADRAAVATADAAESTVATTAVAVALAGTNTIQVAGGILARGYAAGCAMRSHS